MKSTPGVQVYLFMVKKSTVLRLHRGRHVEYFCRFIMIVPFWTTILYVHAEALLLASLATVAFETTLPPWQLEVETETAPKVVSDKFDDEFTIS